MTINIIYFENASIEMREIINKYRSDKMQIIYWHDLDQKEKEMFLGESEYLITATYPITKELLQRTKRVKLIQKTGSGVDNIDIQAAGEFGIQVASTIGANANSVVEMTFGMIISLYRKLHYIDGLTKNGEWKMYEYRSTMYEISGKTHGIIGMGGIGKRVADLSKKFGANVIYYDAYRLSTLDESNLGIAYRTLDELLLESDIVSLHIPLLPSTENLISKRELELMKPTAILVNVARGKIINESDLAEVLKNKRLLGAAIDTWEHEPINRDNPLLYLDNVLATPHIAGGTRDAFEEHFNLSFKNIIKVEKGQTPENLIRVPVL